MRFHLLELSDLDERAFRPELGRLRLFGKSKPPPAPNYEAAAQATAQGNLEATRAATKANRVTQVTPYGALTWSQTGDDPDAGWAQTVTLDPRAQQALDQQLALNRKYGETANAGFDKVRGLFESPGLDTSMLPKRAIDVGQTAQDAIMARLNPQFDRRQEQLETQLTNQGLIRGSEAWNNSMRDLNMARNDASSQAALQGINLDQQNRSSALQEQAYMQDRPLNLINALRTGNQVNNPQFQQFAQQATTQGPNMLGAAQAQYGADVESYNAGQAQQGGLMGGLFALGGAAMGSPWIGSMLGFPSASGGIGGMVKTSDRRLKSDIVRIGTHPLGIGIYQYTIGGVPDVGVMADEVEAVVPSAVLVREDGFKMVDYGRLL